MSEDRFDWVVVEEATLIRSTDRAGLFDVDGDEVWIPWSQIREDSVDQDGESGALFLRRWIAQDKDLEFAEE